MPPNRGSNKTAGSSGTAAPPAAVISKMTHEEFSDWIEEHCGSTPTSPTSPADQAVKAEKKEQLPSSPDSLDTEMSLSDMATMKKEIADELESIEQLMVQTKDTKEEKKQGQKLYTRRRVRKRPRTDDFTDIAG